MATRTSSTVKQQSQYRLWLQWHHSSHNTGYGYTDIVHCQTAVTVQVMAALTSSIVRQQSHYRLWLHWHRPLSDSSHNTGYGYIDTVHCEQPHKMLSARQHSNHPPHTAREAWHFRYVQQDNKFSIRNKWTKPSWRRTTDHYSPLVYSTLECQRFILPWHAQEQKGLFYPGMSSAVKKKIKKNPHWVVDYQHGKTLSADPPKKLAAPKKEFVQFHFLKRFNSHLLNC